MSTLLKVCIIFLPLVLCHNLENKLNRSACAFQCYEENNCFVENCNCTLKDTNFLYLNATFELNLKCVQDDIAYISWDEQKNSVYFLEIIGTEISFTPVTYCNYYIFEELSENTTYLVKVYSVTNNSEIMESKMLNFTTKHPNYKPEPVKSMWFQNLTLNDHYYQTDILWNAPEDKSCYYEIVWYCKNIEDSSNDVIPSPEHAELIDPMELFNVTVTELVFGCDYSFTITTKSSSWEFESSNKTIDLKIPDCLETFNNLSVCPPPKIKNISVWEVQSKQNSDNILHNIYLNWSAPILKPDYYTIILNVFNVSKNFQYNISGDNTNFVFENVECGAHYQLLIQAVSTGGKSPPSILDRTLKSQALQSDTKNIFYGSAAILFLIIILFIIYIVPVQKKESILRTIKIRNHYTENQTYGKTIDDDITKSKVIVKKDRDIWEVDIDNLIFDATIGEGAFGIVYRGLLEKNLDQIPVAIKKLKANPSSEEIREMEKEIVIMKNVGTHPNIVSIIGCITTKSLDGPVLIVEYCSKGNLLNFLRNIYNKIAGKLVNITINNPNTPAYNIFNKSYEMEETEDFGYKDFLSFARQIALGMEYLSGQKVLHRDLAARNILMCENGIVKVSDFGLSRDVYMDSVYYKTTNGRLPVRWMALESLTHQIYTSKSDVWSFGILLWEMTSLGALPYPDIETYELLTYLKQGGRMAKLDNCNDNIYEIMTSCWNEVPAERPSFSCLVNIFDRFLNESGNYMNLYSDEYQFCNDNK